MATAVSIDHVSVKLGRKFTALDRVSVELPKGQIIGIIGPSGAGKTTLIRAIVGRQSVNGGSIKIFDQPAGSARLRLLIRYMTQEVSVYSDLTVRQNLAYFAAMIGLQGKDARSTLASAIDRVDLAAQADQMVSRLSGGQKQRVSLACTLLGTPQLLVLDEPTVGLDPVLRENLWKLFRELANDGVTLIISSHVMDEATRCDDLVLIRDGKLLAHDTPGALQRQTHTETVEAAFLKLVESAE